MSKYGALIQKVRSEAKQEASTPDLENDPVAEFASDGPENQKTRKPENQNSGKAVETEGLEETVNLSIKVPKRLRSHWVAESKRRGTTLTAVITQSLSEQFGEPA